MEDKKLKLSRSIDSTIIEEVVKQNDNNNLDKLGRVYATGRRKESVARVWFKLGNQITINGKSAAEYFPQESLVHNFKLPLKLLEISTVYIYATVTGGGKNSQSDALKLAISKALLLFDINFKSILKANGLLTTDSRVKEREHIGFRTSRKPQQYCRR